MKRRDFFKHAALAGSAAAHPAWSKPDDAKLEAAATLIDRAVAGGRVRGATLTVSQNGRSFRREFGTAGSPHAIFLIASITKPMTAAAVMTLVDKGELALDDPVMRYIPEFGEGARKRITIRHLLTHTSGLPDQLPDNVELRRRQAPLEEFVARAIRTPLLFEPGARVSYQSMGFLLAAEVASRITAIPFPAFLAQTVFEPLEMHRTALGLGRFAISDTQLSQADEAPALYGGSAGDTRDWDWNSEYWRNLAAPWGGAHSSGPDIERFLRYFLAPDGSVVKPETAAAMIVNQTPGLNEPRGIGFVVKPGSFGKGASTRAFGHSGSTGTLAWADPATGLSCVVLTTLPARISNDLLLKPTADLVSEAGRDNTAASR